MNEQNGKELIEVNAIEQALIAGDLSHLSAEKRVDYYNSVCESLGLNPLTQPFEYIRFQGKTRLYARRDCADQLRKIHGVSITNLDKQQVGDLYVVTATAKDKSGKTDVSTGALTIKGLAGDALANALMKAETKAKRRVTLSICGLGFLDETEIETIPAEPEIAQELIAERERELVDSFEYKYFFDKVGDGKDFTEKQLEKIEERCNESGISYHREGCCFLTDTEIEGAEKYKA